MTATPCVFCNPDKRYIIEEREHCIAVCFPESAIKKGHFVVAAKEHVTSLSSLNPLQSAQILVTAVDIAKKAEVILGAEKYYMAAIADQVRHFHIHLLPKMHGDTPIGSHIMSDTGWKGQTGEPVPAGYIESFISALKNM
ncbi:MAG: HIT family protein [Candidatus Auribacterota bacterium]|nr:HIT family protein [Candidatus Auribacterota bacterium]